MWLHVTARTIGHPDYNLTELDELIDEMQLPRIDATREQYLNLISAIFAIPEAVEHLVTAKSRLAMRVIETMSERGEGVLMQDVIVAMIDSLIRSDSRGPQAKELQGRLEHLLNEADFPCMEEHLLIRLLGAYAVGDQWEKFWEVWRIPPKFRAGRSAKMYTFLFRLMADSKQQTRSINALRWTVQEMFHETPPVRPEDELLEALKDCIRVADPLAETLAGDLLTRDNPPEKLASREFVKLWLQLIDVR